MMNDMFDRLETQIIQERKTKALAAEAEFTRVDSVE